MTRDTELVTLWSMWAATIARLAFVLVYLLAGISLPFLLGAAWRAREQLEGRERNAVQGAALAAAAVLFSDLGESVAMVLANMLQGLLALAAIGYVVCMSYWWWTQPERLAQRRMREQAQQQEQMHVEDMARAFHLIFGQ